jgi:hypothetical protein
LNEKRYCLKCGRPSFKPREETQSLTQSNPERQSFGEPYSLEIASALKQIAFYAMRNNRNLYFITSKKNYFGGVHIPFVMIGNGCNSLILPLAQNQVDELVRLFPCSSHLWSISLFHSVSDVSSIVLKIRNLAPEPGFKVILHDRFITTVPALRFHLHLEDAQRIRDLSDTIKIKSKYHQILLNWISMVESIHGLGIMGAKRRTHALLGQSLLENYNCHQMSPMFVATSKEFPMKLLKDTMATVYDKARSEVEEFGEKDFSTLLDDDHDIDNPKIHEFIYYDENDK